MNNKQIIISVGREFGSGGHAIAQDIAIRFGLPLYDSNLLQEIAAENNLDAQNLHKYDEKPKLKLFYRNVQGYSNSPEENIANLQFDYLRDKAASGESFVIVGRCAEEVLKHYPCMVSVFILGDMEKKIERLMQLHNISADKAESMIVQNNKKRKAYHNHYCKGRWGDSRNYELSINSSKLGLEKTADLIEDYIHERIKSSESSRN